MAASPSTSSRVRDGNQLRSKLSKWAMTKKELADLQKECFLEQHNIKIRQLEEKHKNEMCLQEQESKEKMRMALEEHNAKMEILKLEKQILLKKLQS